MPAARNPVIYQLIVLLEIGGSMTSGLEETLKFNELVRLLEQNGFGLSEKKVRFATMPKPV